MRPVKKVLVLHSLCSVGKASLTNMLPVLSAMNVETCPVPTMLLSTHTGGYGAPAVFKTPVEYIKACADHYHMCRITFDMIFIGYLGAPEMVSAAEYVLEQFPGTPVVLDPIMGDGGTYYSNFHEDYKQALLRLLPKTELILPNLTEACLLTETPWKDTWEKAEAGALLLKLSDCGASRAVITSVHLTNGRLAIAYSGKETPEWYEKDALSFSFHGSGDIFDGVLLGKLLNGNGMDASIEAAHQFVVTCMKESRKYDFEEREGLLVEKCLVKLV